MKLSILTRSSLRYLTRHPWQTGLSILGIALGVAVVVAIDLANQGAENAFRNSMQSITGKATHQIIGGPAGVDDSLYSALKTQSGIQQIAPVIERPVVLEHRSSGTFTLLGIDPFAEKPFRNFLNDNGLQNNRHMLFSFLTQPGAILMSAFTAEEMGIDISDTVSIKFGGVQKKAFIAGLIKPLDTRSKNILENMLICDIATAQELLNMGHYITRIDVILQGSNSGQHREAIESLLPQSVQLLPANARTETAEQMVSAFHLNLTAMSLLGLIVGMFLIYNTMTFSVVQRRSHIGLQRSIGVTRREIFSLILNEAMFLGLIGTSAGIVIGILLGRGLIHLITQSINDLYFVLTVRTFEISKFSLFKGFVLGMGATILAALKPAREATSAPPRVVLSRSIVETSLREKIAVISFIGLGLSIVGAAILWVPNKNILLSYTGLIPLVIGISMLTPFWILVFVRILNPVMGRIFGILGRMATRSLVAQISRTSVAIAALSIAVATTIGVGTMINSFRGTVVNWLENLLSADIYMSAPGFISRQSDSTLDPSLAERIGALPEVEHLNYYREVQITTPTGPVIILTAKIGAHRYENFTFKYGDPNLAWPAYQNDEAIIVSEPFAYRHDVKVGDMLALPTDRGEKKFKVMGVYYDYGTDQGLVSMEHKTYLKYWDDPRLTGILVYAYKNTNIENLKKKIRALTNPDEEIYIQSNTALLNTSVQIFDRTFLITYVLQTLAIVVAFVGVLSALMALQLERSREFGILRANGLTPGQLWKLVFLQTGLMGFISGLISLPIGNILALVLIRVINERSFGWSIQFDVMPNLMVRAILLALLAAIFAGLYPSYKMSKTSPALALREE